MPYLALAVDSEIEAGTTTGAFGVPIRIGPIVQRQLGSHTLLYRLAGGLVEFIATARLSGILAPREGGRVCVVEDLQPLPVRVISLDEAGARGAESMLLLSEARFQEILGESGDTDPPLLYAHEATQAFISDTSLPPGLTSIIEGEVLERWEYRCALTETQFSEKEGRRYLKLVPIRPLTMGGPLDASNFLPMVELAERSWLDGAIGVGPELDLLGQLDALDADLYEAFPQHGRLIVPDNPAHRPDPAQLSWHRINIFGRSRGGFKLALR